MNTVISAVFCLGLCTCCAGRLASHADQRKMQRSNPAEIPATAPELMLKTAGKDQANQATNWHPGRACCLSLCLGEFQYLLIQSCMRICAQI